MKEKWKWNVAKLHDKANQTKVKVKMSTHIFWESEMIKCEKQSFDINKIKMQKDEWNIQWLET